MGHQGVCLLFAERGFELAVQVESGAVVDRHVVLLVERSAREVGDLNGTRGLSQRGPYVLAFHDASGLQRVPT
jgi:hypothetical protein